MSAAAGIIPQEGRPLGGGDILYNAKELVAQTKTWEIVGPLLLGGESRHVTL